MSDKDKSKECLCKGIVIKNAVSFTCDACGETTVQDLNEVEYKDFPLNEPIITVTYE